MQISALEILFSEKRLQTYYRLFQGDREKALSYYLLNIEISQSCYPLLSTVEIILRNAIHNSCIAHFGTDQWLFNTNISSIDERIQKASVKIMARKQIPTPDLLVAELTFGFWTSLFHKRHAKYFWKPLMHIFPYSSGSQKQRDKISYKLEQVRKFRNRIFHYEPVCNDLYLLKQNHTAIIEIMSWINKDIISWLPKPDHFDQLHRSACWLLKTDATIVGI